MTKSAKQKKSYSLKYGIALTVIAIMIVAVCVIVTFFNGTFDKTESMLCDDVKIEKISGAKLVNHPDSPFITYSVENDIQYITFTDPNDIYAYDNMQSYVQYFYMYYIGLDANGQSSHGQYYLSNGFFYWTNLGKVTVASFMDNVTSATKPADGMPLGYYDVHFSIKYYEEKEVMNPNDPTYFVTGQTRIKYGSWSALPPTPSKTGYTFGGWYSDENFTQPYTNEYVTSDINLYAKFNVINYSIIYNTNEGTVNGLSSYNIESETYVLPTPTLTGYDFIGWYSSADFTGDPVTEIPQGSTGDVTVYAKWKIQVYKVSFYVDGELYLEMDVEYGTRLVDLYLVDTQTLEAVAFSLDAEMLTAYDANAMITNDMSLFSSEKFAVYAGLTYNIDGVETMDLLDYNSTLSDLRVPEKDGYTFDGWFYDAEYTKAVSSTDKLMSNKTIYAKFTEIAPETFGDKVAKFFSDWWWCFAVGAAVIAVGTVLIIVKTKRSARK